MYGNTSGTEPGGVKITLKMAIASKRMKKWIMIK